jgi:serine/threonine protein kinase
VHQRLSPGAIVAGFAPRSQLRLVSSDHEGYAKGKTAKDKSVPLNIGDHLAERFEITACLGRGDSAVTYAAYSLETQTPVVIKEVALSGIESWKQLQLFEREAEVLSHIHHPAIPDFLDYFELEQAGIMHLYLITEKVPGRNLAEMLAENWLADENFCIRISQQLLPILSYLHAFNPPIIHRDIKPSNLMWDGQQLYLIDFGGVQGLFNSEGAGGSTVIGTFGYMAPEQYHGRSVPATDLYALGATLIHLLAGRSPAQMPQRNMKVLFRTYVDCSAAFARWLDHLVQPEAQQRLSSAQAALQALPQTKAPVHSQAVLPKPRTAPRPSITTRTTRDSLPSLGDGLWPPGTVLWDTYTLTEVLGQGSAITTYSADHAEQGPVVIKTLLFNNLEGWKNYELFEREVKTLQQLQHPRIPRFLDWRSEVEGQSQRFYLVSQRVEGETLAQRLQQGWRPTEAEIWDIAAQILEILDYLQSQPAPFIHRDLKPSNLILDRDNRIHLIDFGAVHHLFRPQGAGGSTVVGTFGYMAPEQFLGRAVTATDLYSLAMTLIHLLTGKAPADMPQLDLKPNFDPFLNTTPELREWLHYLCEPALEKRCQSARQAHTILLDLTSEIIHNPTLMNLGSPPGERIRQMASNQQIKWVVAPPPEQQYYSKLKYWHQQVSIGAFLLASPLCVFLGSHWVTQLTMHSSQGAAMGGIQTIFLVIFSLLVSAITSLGVIIPASILRMCLDQIYQPQYIAEATFTLTANKFRIHRNQDNYSDRIFENIADFEFNRIPLLKKPSTNRKQYNHKIDIEKITAVYYRPLRTWKLLYHSPFYEFIFLQDDGSYARSVMAMSANEARWFQLALLAAITRYQFPKVGEALRRRSEDYQQRLLPPGGE